MKTPAYVAFFLAALAVAALPQDKKKPEPRSKSPILVIDLLRVTQEADEARELIDKLNQARAAEKQRLAEDLARLQEKVKQLNEAKLADRTPEFYREFERAMGTKARLQQEEALSMARKTDEITRRMQQLILGAMEFAREVMKERGAEIVLVSKMGRFEIASDQQLQEEFVMRRVFCCAEDVDVTNEVLRRMNAWYAQHKSSQGVPERAVEGAGEGDAREGDAKKEEGRAQGAAKKTAGQ